MMMLFISIFTIGMYMFSSKRKHLLLTLLSLEYMVLGIFYVIFMNYMQMNFFVSLVYLTFSACEGALGLSILVSMSRSYGSDYFSVFNIY